MMYMMPNLLVGVAYLIFLKREPKAKLLSAVPSDVLDGFNFSFLFGSIY